MPSGSYRQVYVKCPFYLYDDGAGRICCEGIAPETTVATMFRHRSQLQQLSFIQQAMQDAGV